MGRHEGAWWLGTIVFFLLISKHTQGSKNVGAEAAAFLLGVQALPKLCNDVVFLADFFNSLAFEVGGANYKNEKLVEVYTQVAQEKARMKKLGAIRWSHVHHPGHQKDTSWFTVLNLVADNIASCKMDVNVQVPVADLTNLALPGKKGLASCKSLIEKYAKAQTSAPQKQDSEEEGSSKKRKADGVGHHTGKKNKVASIFAAKQSTATAKEEETKPILVILQGASGKLSANMTNLFLPALVQSGHWDIRVRPEGSWTNGWHAKNNATVVVNDLGLCPKDADAAPWFVMGCSFGNRVATSIVSDALTPVAPGLILMGYPMYGDNGKEDRVKHIQKLPPTANVLAISGENDSCLKSNVPEGKPHGRALWDHVVAGMPCRDQTTVKYVAKGGHGVYEDAKTGPAKIRKNEATIQILQWMKDFKHGLLTPAASSVGSSAD
jgi:hypothetical protein